MSLELIAGIAGDWEFSWLRTAVLGSFHVIILVMA